MKPGIKQLHILKESSFTHPIEGPMIYLKSKKQKDFLRRVVVELKDNCMNWETERWGENEAQATTYFRTIPFAKEDGVELAFEGQITYQTSSWSIRCMPKSKGKFPFGVILFHSEVTPSNRGHFNKV